MDFASNFSGEKVWFSLLQVIFHINFLLVDSDDNNLFQVLEFNHEVVSPCFH